MDSVETPKTVVLQIEIVNQKADIQRTASSKGSCVITVMHLEYCIKIKQLNVPHHCMNKFLNFTRLDATFFTNPLLQYLYSIGAEINGSKYSEGNKAQQQIVANH